MRGDPPTGSSGRRAAQAAARLAAAVRSAYRAYATGGASLAFDATLWRWVAGTSFAGLGAFALLMLLLAVAVGGLGVSARLYAASCEADVTDSAPVVDTDDLIELYEAASARYGLDPMGPAVLAAINRVESDFGTNMGPSSAGAVGWMQFMPGTWYGPEEHEWFERDDGRGGYGVDANGDGKRDPYDAADGIFGAANYLAASGAPGDWRGALFAYNRVPSYVDEVWALAERFDRTGRVITRSGRVIGEFSGQGSLVALDRGTQWAWPTTSRNVTSGYGWRWGRIHHGVDIAAPEGTPIFAALAGEVVHSAWTGGYGHYTCVSHRAQGLTTCYAHQSRRIVTPGQPVGAGDVIGHVGNTGHSFGAHLHFEVREGMGPSAPSTDPMPFLQGASNVTSDLLLAADAVPGGCGITVSDDGGPIAGGARGIVERAAEIARPFGTYVVSAHRPGDPLDHGSNDSDRAARDIAVEGIDAIHGPPSPRLDRAVVAIGEYFGREYELGTTVEGPGNDDTDTFIWRGYRIQIIWRTPKYGGHMGHIHIGVRKVDGAAAA